AMRALDAKTDGTLLAARLTEMGMELFDPPTVNGWNNGLAWMASGQFLARLKFAQELVRDTGGKPYKILPTTLYSLPFNAAAVVDGLLARLHVAGQVPPGVRQQLITYMGVDPNPAIVEPKIRGAVALILALPESHIH